MQTKRILHIPPLIGDKIRFAFCYEMKKGLFLVPVGPPAPYLGFHLGRIRAVQAGDISFLFSLGFHLGLFFGAFLLAFEDNSACHGFFYFLIHVTVRLH